MYFEDLSLCEYATVHAQFWRVPLLAVGWLEDSHVYSRGTIPPEVRSRLLEMLKATKAILWPNGFMGLHECSLCQAAGSPTSILYDSALNMFVPGKDCVYAVPGAIDHYFQVHNYCPPEAFCEAVLESALCDAPSYWQALHTLNGGPVVLGRVYKVDGEKDRVGWDGDRTYTGQEREDLMQLVADYERRRRGS